MTPRPKFFWKECIDWSKTSRQIAQEVGCSVNLVAVSRNHYAKGTGVQVKQVDWTAVDWTKSNRKIATAVGRALSCVSAARKQFGAGAQRRYEKPPGSDPRQTRHRGQNP